MASRRAVSSAVSVAAAVRPAASRAASAQRCAAAAAALSAPRAFSTAAPVRTVSRAFTASIAQKNRLPSAAASRWYSAEPAPTKLWSFEEIQKQLETNEDENVVFVGTFQLTPNGLKKTTERKRKRQEGHD